MELIIEEIIGNSSDKEVVEPELRSFTGRLGRARRVSIHVITQNADLSYAAEDFTDNAIKEEEPVEIRIQNTRRGR